MTQSYRQLPPAEELKQILRYDLETGILYRIARDSKRYGRLFPIDPPRPVGRMDDWGYLRCDLDGMSNLQVSRVIWRLCTGEDPGQQQVDHINQDKTDNRLQNLRLAEVYENLWNRGPQANKQFSSYKGVTCVRDRHGEIAYVIARISVNGKRIYLGTFPTEQEAYAAYCAAAALYHDEFGRTA